MFGGRRRPRVRARWKVAFIIVAALAALLVVNTIALNHQTKPANADIGRILRLPGGDLQVREDGPAGGAPVVLIHGWTASMHWWDEVVKRLRSKFRLVRFDLLGHGGSEKPKSGYSIEHQAQQIALALRVLRVKNAVVAGHSAGGEVAIALAARHPELVSHLMVVDTKPASRYGRPNFLTKLSLKPVLGQALRRVATDGEIRRGLGQAFMKGYKVPRQFVRDFRKLTFDAYKKTFDESGDYVKQGRLTRDFKRITAPTMVVFGAEDRLVDSEAAVHFPSRPRVRVVIVPDAGHAPMVQQPDTVAGLFSQLSSLR
jgi:pimeloyl-ACP methyl ester carboxylesterase